MSTQPVAPTPSALPAAPRPAPPLAGPDVAWSRVVAGALAAAAALSAAVVLWQPWGERDDLSYGTLAAHRDDAWLGSILDGVASAGMGIGLGLAACMLVRGRGRTLATVGAVLAAVGGVLLSAGVIAFGVLAWYVTDPAALPAEAGTTMMTYVDENLGHLMAVQGSGFLLATLGGLTLMGALWRARVVPVALPAAYVALTVGVFTTQGTVLNGVQAAQSLSLLVVAGLLVTRARR